MQVGQNQINAGRIKSISPSYVCGDSGHDSGTSGLVALYFHCKSKFLYKYSRQVSIALAHCKPVFYFSIFPIFGEPMVFWCFQGL